MVETIAPGITTQTMEVDRTIHLHMGKTSQNTAPLKCHVWRGYTYLTDFKRQLTVQFKVKRAKETK